MAKPKKRTFKEEQAAFEAAKQRRAKEKATAATTGKSDWQMAKDRNDAARASAATTAAAGKTKPPAAKGPLQRLTEALTPKSEAQKAKDAARKKSGLY